MVLRRAAVLLTMVRDDVEPQTSGFWSPDDVFTVGLWLSVFTSTVTSLKCRWPKHPTYPMLAILLVS